MLAVAVMFSGAYLLSDPISVSSRPAAGGSWLKTLGAAARFVLMRIRAAVITAVTVAVAVLFPAGSAGAVEEGEWPFAIDAYIRTDDVTSPLVGKTPTYFGGVTGDGSLMCDFDGDGIDTPVVHRKGQWISASSWVTGAPVSSFWYGSPDDVAVCGDFDGDGDDDPAVVRGNQWLIRTADGSGVATHVLTLGLPGDIPVVGDWDGDGVDGPGMFRQGRWVLKNTITPGPADIVFGFGSAGHIPVVGDWDGDGTDTVGVFDHGVWITTDTHTPNANRWRWYGTASDVPFTGDFNGDGTDTFAVGRSIGKFSPTEWAIRNEFNALTSLEDILVDIGAEFFTAGHAALLGYHDIVEDACGTIGDSYTALSTKTDWLEVDDFGTGLFASMIHQQTISVYAIMWDRCVTNMTGPELWDETVDSLLQLNYLLRQARGYGHQIVRTSAHLEEYLTIQQNRAAELPDIDIDLYSSSGSG